MYGPQSIQGLMAVTIAAPPEKVSRGRRLPASTVGQLVLRMPLNLKSTRQRRGLQHDFSLGAMPILSVGRPQRLLTREAGLGAVSITTNVNCPAGIRYSADTDREYSVPFLAAASMNFYDFLRNSVFNVGYFNWWLVSIYILILGVFLYGILQPRRKKEWKSAGAAQAWVIALYAEMYGTPLTAYLVMGLLGRSQADAEKHINGHLWPVFLGLSEDSLIRAQFLFTLCGQLMILTGALLAIFGWRQLHRAVQHGEMASTGLYRYIRHPQYTGFFLFLLGSMINWPTLVTLITMPILWFVYLRLAMSEEQDAISEFGPRYRDYMSTTGRFLPFVGRLSGSYT